MELRAPPTQVVEEGVLLKVLSQLIPAVPALLSFEYPQARQFLSLAVSHTPPQQFQTKPHTL
jgi:hypothetical protein